MAREEHPETKKMRRWLRWRVGVPMYIAAAASAMLVEPLDGPRAAFGVVITAAVGFCMATLVLVPELLQRAIDVTAEDRPQDIAPPATSEDPVAWHKRLDEWARDNTGLLTLAAVIGALLLPFLVAL